MHRLRYPDYVLFTLQLKVKELYLNSFSKSPYHSLPSDVSFESSYPASINYIDRFHSFDYHNFNSAKKYYGTPHYVITKIILALIMYNDVQVSNDGFIAATKRIFEEGTISDDKLFFYYYESLPKHSIYTDKYYSGITQGKASSLFVRAYNITKDEKYLDYAEMALKACTIHVDKDGILRNIKSSLCWIEEYPSSDEPSLVLNGHLFTIIGFADYLAHRDNLVLLDLYNKIIESTISLIRYYTLPQGLLYSLRSWKLCNVHYIGLMIPLCDHVYKITEKNEFIELKQWLIERFPKELFYKTIYNNKIPLLVVNYWENELNDN